MVLRVEKACRREDRKRSEVIYRKPSSGGWRANLFTGYIDNLSSNVTSKMIWDVFNRFGNVMEVYIPPALEEEREWSPLPL